MKRTIVNDRIQKATCITGRHPVGRNFAPGFDAQLAPKQMLEHGGHTQALRAGRRRLPLKAATGGFALGL
jgi:hypothetical protein